MEDITKHYSNGEVTVVWKPALCTHSTICWRRATGLPEVFHPKTRPWITPDGAGTDAIVQQVAKCPSGALSTFMNAVAPPRASETLVQEAAPGQAMEIIAEVLQNGPLMVYGNVNVKGTDGTETRRSNVTAFCRCGASANKPFCDGSHVRTGFRD